MDRMSKQDFHQLMHRLDWNLSNLQHEEFVCTPDLSLPA